MPGVGISRLDLRSDVPHTKYKTPPNPKIHPEIHPKSPSRTEIQKKYEKYTKLSDFCIFLVFFLYFGFGEGFGVHFGVYFGVRRAFGFCTGGGYDHKSGFRHEVDAGHGIVNEMQGNGAT